MWPVRVRKAFRPWVTDLLVHGWRGRDVIALGRVAFDWFGHDRATRDRLAAWWARDDRFEGHVEVDLVAPDDTTRRVRVHPQPPDVHATIPASPLACPTTAGARHAHRRRDELRPARGGVARTTPRVPSPCG